MAKMNSILILLLVGPAIGQFSPGFHIPTDPFATRDQLVLGQAPYEVEFKDPEISDTYDVPNPPQEPELPDTYEVPQVPEEPEIVDTYEVPDVITPAPVVTPIVTPCVPVCQPTCKTVYARRERLRPALRRFRRSPHFGKAKKAYKKVYKSRVPVCGGGRWKRSLKNPFLEVNRGRQYPHRDSALDILGSKVFGKVQKIRNHNQKKAAAIYHVKDKLFGSKFNGNRYQSAPLAPAYGRGYGYGFTPASPFRGGYNSGFNPGYNSGYRTYPAGYGSGYRSGYNGGYGGYSLPSNHGVFKREAEEDHERSKRHLFKKAKKSFKKVANVPCRPAVTVYVDYVPEEVCSQVCRTVCPYKK